MYWAPIPEEMISDVKIKHDFFKPVIYPNPANESVWLKFYLENKIDGTLMITDAAGNTIHTQAIRAEDNNAIFISTKKWASGLYFYTLKTGEYKTSGKFIVE